MHYFILFLTVILKKKGGGGVWVMLAIIQPWQNMNIWLLEIRFRYYTYQLTTHSIPKINDEGMVKRLR